MLGVECLRRVLVRGHIDGLVPPEIPALGPRRVDPGTAHHQRVLHRIGTRIASSTASFNDTADPRRYWPSVVITSLASASEIRARNADAEYPRTPHCAAPQPRARQHRHDRFRDHRHVDRHAVPGHQPKLGQRIRRPRHLDQQLRIRDGAAVADRLALPPDRHSVTVARLDVAVHAVVGHVELASDEPLGHRRLRPVQHVGERCLPRQPRGLLGPEPQPVDVGLPVQFGGPVGLGGELRGRRIGRGSVGACVVHAV